VALLGGGGMLAHEIASLFRSAGFDVEAIARTECDITDGAAVERAVVGAGLVINCAAYTHVDRAETEPERAFAVNARGAGNVARAAARAGATLVHISTDYVFDGSLGRPHREDDPTAAIGVYGRSKLAGEGEVLAAGGRTYIVRTGELYGTGGRNFFEAILTRARAGGALRVVADQIVTPTWTRELAAQLVALVEAPPGIFHATADGATSWYDAARAVIELAGLDVQITPVTTEAYGSPTPRPRYSVLAHDALQRLGLYRMRAWRDALADWIAHG
jgi:dTDP-4-dehydrorhamnose reductase